VLRMSAFRAKLLQACADNPKKGYTSLCLWRNVGLPVHRSCQTVFDELEKMLDEGWLEISEPRDMQEIFSITKNGRLALSAFNMQHKKEVS